MGYHVDMSKQFVIQAHSGCGPLHYDMMLACGEALATWRFDAQPTDASFGRPLMCKRIQDHRLAYLSYEGTVSNGRGRVDIFDRGEYDAVADDEGRWEFVLHGRRISGRFELVREGEHSTSWIFRLID